jgi:hypothetical protein
VGWGCTWGWTQGLELAMQALYHLRYYQPIFCVSIEVWVTWLYTSVRTHPVSLKGSIYFTVCKFSNNFKNNLEKSFVNSDTSSDKTVLTILRGKICKSFLNHTTT